MCNIMGFEGDVGFRTALEVLTFGLISRSLALKIVASCPITSWQIDVETMETVKDFISLGSKITADVTVAMKLKDGCSLEEKL